MYNDYNDREEYGRSDHNGFVDGSYHYSYVNEREQSRDLEENERPKKKSRGLAAKIIAVCLACVILGGAAGAGVAVLAQKNSAQPVQVNFSGKSKATEEAVPTVTAAIGGETDASEPTALQSSVSVNLGASALTAPQVFETYSGKELAATDIYELGSKSVVIITVEMTSTNYYGQTYSGKGYGSGFIISTDGYILTNAHMVSDASGKVEVELINGDKYEAKIIGFEEESDVGLIKIDARNLTPVVLVSSANLRVGEMIYAIGNPQYESYTMTHGIVSALDRDIATSANQIIRTFQMDVPINSGSSGGPVFNNKGEVVGIATAKSSDSSVEGMCYAVPIDEAVYIAKELITNGYVSGKPQLGVTVVTVTEQAAAYYNMVPGAYVQSVVSGSGADKAGIKEGDIITALGDKKVESDEELTAAKKSYKAGDTVKITVYRAGEYLTFDITLDERARETETEQPEPEQNGQNPFGGSSPYGGYGYNPYGGYGGYGYGYNPFGDIFSYFGF